MLWDILRLAGDEYPDWNKHKEPMKKIISRYAGVLERMIAPDGSFPVIGRSLPYRFGAFQALAQAALDENLPEGVCPAQVRCALTAVMKKVMSAPDTFDQDGWLNIGLYGNQPDIAEIYITTGSSYLCTAAFLPLGLSPKAAFWADPDAHGHLYRYGSKEKILQQTTHWNCNRVAGGWMLQYPAFLLEKEG